MLVFKFSILSVAITVILFIAMEMTLVFMNGEKKFKILYVKEEQPLYFKIIKNGFLFFFALSLVLLLVALIIVLFYLW